MTQPLVQRAIALLAWAGIWLRRTLLAALMGATAVSAFSVVYTKHLSRSLFAELRITHKARNELYAEYDRLLLEQGTVAANVRIEHIARSQFDMVTPPAASIVMVKP